MRGAGAAARARRVGLACLLAALAAGCAAPPGCAGLPGRSALEVRMFFGLSRPDGRPVSDAEWDGFLAAEVTPRFPDGLTVLDGSGQWLDRAAARLTRERSRMVLILSFAAPGDVSAAAETVAAAYRTRFAQQSVGIATSHVCAAF